MVASLSVPLWFVFAGLVIAAGGTLSLAVYTATTSDGDRTQQAFSILLTSVFVWTAGQGGRLLTGSLGGKLVWQAVLYVGIVATPFAWTGFTLLYTGRSQYVRRGTVTLALVEPVVTLAMLYTNRSHQLFYHTVDLTYLGRSPILTTAAGPYWWVHFGVSYLLVGVGIVLLVQFALTADSLYRIQTVGITFAALLPLGVNVLFIFDVLANTTVDLTPLAFALSTVFLFGTMFYGRLFDLVPVAHDAVVRTLEDGVLVVDGNGRIVSANPASATMLTGPDDSDSVVGRELSAVEPTLAVTSDEFTLTDSSGIDRGFEAAAVSDGDPDWYWVRQVDLSSTTKQGSVVTLTDITNRKLFERRLRELQRTHQQLLVAEDEDHVADIAVESAKEVLGLPITGIWKRDASESVLRPRGMTDEACELIGTQPVLDDDDLAWNAFADDELKRYTDLRTNPAVHNPETPIESEIHVPISDWGVMTSGSATRTEFRDVEFDLLRLLATGVERAFARLEREQRIRRLHRRTSELMRAESPGEIARTAVETADDVLGQPLSGIHLLADDEPVLEATAVTPTVREAFDTVPAYRRDADGDIDGLVWEVFRRDEALVVEDVAESAFPATDSPVRSVVVHSLGEHGVFITSSPEPNAFDRTDRALAELFTTTVTAALDRVDRERQLRERERELSRQNERLEEFTSVVSHDLRSPLNEATLYLDMAASEYDDDRIDSAVSATERAEAMVDDLLALARQGRTVEAPEPTDLGTSVHEAWAAVPTGDGSLETDGELGVVEADPARLRQAFENLFRNATEHGGEGVRVRVGQLTDPTGVYVADDGPGIPVDIREDVFDHGYTTAESGTGFGLAIVKRIVEAHGWRIRVTESDDDGTRFEITGMHAVSR